MPTTKTKAKNEFWARKLATHAPVDKTSTAIKPPKKLRNNLPKGKRQMSRTRKEKIKSV